MSMTDASTKVIMTEEQAEEYLRRFQSDTIPEPTAKLFADSTQFLALGGLTVAQVYASAISDAREQNDYGVNRVFDVLSGSRLAYGKHVAYIAGGINPSTLVTPSIVYTKGYPKVRDQIMFTSDLQMDSTTGRQYRTYARRKVTVAGTANDWQHYELKSNSERELQLFTETGTDTNGASFEKFFTVKDGKKRGISLADPYIIDSTVNLIEGSGAIELYETALNEMPKHVRARLADSPQMLFWSVFKQIKSQINQVWG